MYNPIVKSADLWYYIFALFCNYCTYSLNEIILSVIKHEKYGRI